MTTDKSLTATKYVESFRKAFSLGVESIVSAAQIYVEAIDDNPKNADVFRSEFDDCIPASAWAGFEAVGRKWMHPKLLLGGGGRYSNNIKRLPYSTQERIFSGEKFDLLTKDGDKLKVDVRSITPEQAEQIFEKTTIRTLPEQKAWLESRREELNTKVDEVIARLPYVIRGAKVHFKANTTLTREEVKRLALEMM